MPHLPRRCQHKASTMLLTLHTHRKRTERQKGARVGSRERKGREGRYGDHAVGSGEEKDETGAKWPQFNVFPGHTQMRVKNVGFSYQQMIEGDKDINFSEIQKRRTKMFYEYSGRLMRL